MHEAQKPPTSLLGILPLRRASYLVGELACLRNALWQHQYQRTGCLSKRGLNLALWRSAFALGASACQRQANQP